jgi:hypothetical protein
MAISKKAKKEINDLIDAVVNKYLQKAKDKPKSNSGNPFIMALLKDFEPLIHRIHGLKTSMGNEMEKIAEIIAIETWGKKNVTRKINVNVKLPQNVFQEIDTIINNLSNAKTLSNYYIEKNKIFKACDTPSSNNEEHKFEFDLMLKNPKNNEYIFLEMKGPDPNTTEVPGAKKRLLVALAYGYMKYKTKNIDCHFAIYYNNKYPKPYKNPKVHYYFDPNGGIIAHDNFWNFLGKDKSTFNEVVKLFDEYGKKNKKRIWDGFSKLIKL